MGGNGRIQKEGQRSERHGLIDDKRPRRDERYYGEETDGQASWLQSENMKKQ